MIRVETSAPQPARWHRQSTHRTLDAAAKAAARTEAACARIVVDASTLAALVLSGEVYRSAGGELVAASHGVTVEAL